MAGDTMENKSQEVVENQESKQTNTPEVKDLKQGAVEVSPEKEINVHLSKIQEILQKGQTADDYINQNEKEIKALIDQGGLDKIYKESRSGKDLFSKDNTIAIQLYGRVQLGDKDTKVDGLFGDQTTAIYRYMQKKGIGGDAINVSINDGKQKEYVDMYERLENQKNVTQINSLTIQKIELGNSNIGKGNILTQNLIQNEQIQKSIENIKDEKPIDKDVFKSMLVNEGEIQKTLNEILKNEDKKDIIISCFDKNGEIKEENKRSKDVGEPSKQLRELLKTIKNTLDQKVDEKILVYQENVLKETRKASYDGCIMCLEKVLKQDVEDQEYNDEIDKMFSKIDQSNDVSFDGENLKINGKINGQEILFDYNIMTGKLSMSKSLYKDSKGDIYLYDKKLQEINIKLPSFKETLKRMKESIVSRKKILQHEDIVDVFVTTQKRIYHEIPKDGSEEVKKTLQKDETSKNFLELIGIGKNKKETFGQQYNEIDQYKLCQYFLESLDKYSTKEIIEFRKNIKDLSQIINKYKSAEEKNKEKKIKNDPRNDFFSKEKLEEDENNILNQKNENTWWLFFTQMIDLNDKNPDSNNYHKIQIKKIKEMVDVYEKKGVLAIKETEPINDYYAKKELKKMEDNNFNFGYPDNIT